MKTIFTLLVSIIAFQITVQAQTPIEATIPFQGYEETSEFLGVGEYQIFLDNIDGVLDKPIIIVDGYDPNDNSNIGNIYNYLSYGDPVVNIFDDLRTNEGCDIIVLNFPNYTREADDAEIHGGGDYIERNGLILVELIEKIKLEMVGDQKMGIIGPSMGGLITRYALAYMEQNGLDHETYLWMSFDSPHRGANIPISLQYMVNYLAEAASDESMATMRDLELNSSAAKQMLLDHYSSHLGDDEAYIQDESIQLPTPATVFRDQFTANMTALGFPETTRNVSISNGSNTGTSVESPGVTMIDTNLDLSDTVSIDVYLAFTPDADVEDYVVDNIQGYYSGYPIGEPYITKAASPATTAGLDSTPGGTVLFENYLGSSSSDIVDAFIAALEIDSFSFIPALSSLAIANDNWYAPTAGTSTPHFDASYTPTENERHLTVTPDSASFIMDEITSLYVGIAELATANFELLQNPVTDSIRLQLDNTNRQININISTITGQNIVSYSFTNPNRIITVPSPENGYYLVSISDGNSRVTKKLIVLK